MVNTLNRKEAFIVTMSIVKCNCMTKFQSYTRNRIKAFSRITLTGYAYFFLGMSLITFSACEQETEIVFVVESSLQDYFDRFVDEGALRGINIAYATSQVEAHISDIPEPNVIGQCAWNHTSHSITIDRNYWRTANDMQREFVVFHELGHCVLELNHVDGADGNGNCESIMTSGTGNCRVVYTINNRERLLNELFNY